MPMMLPVLRSDPPGLGVGPGGGAQEEEVVVDVGEEEVVVDVG